MNNILTEITNSMMMLRPGAYKEIEKLLNMPSQKDIDRGYIPISVSGASLVTSINRGDSSSSEEKSVAIVPIIGPMFKYDSWWNYGIDHYASIIQSIDADPSIDGTILLLNTPGGSVQSTIRMEEVLKNRKKPCVAMIDGMACSSGMYIASYSDFIMANNPMCLVGSIGTMVTIEDNSKMLEKYGIKLIEIYPPESSYKNKGYKEALSGDTSYIVNELLSPYAIQFQNVIKKNRPKLDLSVEGIIEGRDFFAKDAVSNGLIDAIGTLEDSVSKVYQLSEDRKDMFNLFTN